MTTTTGPDTMPRTAGHGPPFGGGQRVPSPALAVGLFLSVALLGGCGGRVAQEAAPQRAAVQSEEAAQARRAPQDPGPGTTGGTTTAGGWGTTTAGGATAGTTTGYAAEGGNRGMLGPIPGGGEGTPPALSGLPLRERGG